MHDIDPPVRGAPPRHPQCRIGTSGYQYAHWRGLFYPPALSTSAWLGYFAARFDTVEINNTFYRLPAAETLARWRRSAPPGFLFAVKYNRFGSHLKHLKDPPQHLPPFLERARRLGLACGPVLVQLPPHWRADPSRLADFLAALPARQRWAFEFRNPTWLTDSIFTLLHRHGAALCVHDLLPEHPRVYTARWAYLRYHGAGQPDGNYTSAALAAEVEHIAALRARRMDVYAYFNNDWHGYALRNAAELRTLVGSPQTHDAVMFNSGPA